MQFSFLVSSLLIIANPVFANGDDAQAKNEQEEAIVPTEDDTLSVPPVAEIIVFGEMEIQRKRAKVIENLRHLGYREVKEKDGRSVLRPAVPYKPTVIVDDDAWIHTKRSPVRVDPPGKKDNKLRYLWCLPPFTITAACIQVGGQVISERKLAHFKADVARATSYEVRQWREVLIAHAMEKRLGEEVPDMLDDIWTEGKTDDHDAPLLDDHTQRRAVIMDFWASRSCVPEGDAVRRVAADFITEVIQHSEYPATVTEIEATNGAQRCPESIPLPISSTTTP